MYGLLQSAQTETKERVQCCEKPRKSQNIEVYYNNTGDLYRYIINVLVICPNMPKKVFFKISFENGCQ